MKYRYDSSYEPPVPSMEIWVATPERAFSIGPLHAIIDTGADATLVPLHFVEQLGIDAFDLKRLRSHWGEARTVETFLADIGVDGLRVPLVELVADARSAEVLLGRDVLNALRMTLDGPKQTVDIKG